PIVIHEANAKPGMANSLGAALTRPGRVGVTFPGTKLRGAELVGMPMPAAITDLDRDDPSVRAAARAALGLTDSRPVLVVTGGASGAQRTNEAF
ncbi:UDP-N-acetylglucosamine--N-acetylmuramyl-(pentapeptide) pyrophosphoryl-undecaprenol N-acetylglucosamine transferase, partial [Burkholderia multivorans]